MSQLLQAITYWLQKIVSGEEIGVSGVCCWKYWFVAVVAYSSILHVIKEKHQYFSSIPDTSPWPCH